jgi:hypothetical protein
MLIILEGPDGAGKSTLALELVKKIAARRPRDGVDAVHVGPPTRHPINEYLRPLRTYRPGANQHLILDRWHWGEAIYPQIRGRKTELDDAGWWSIEAYLRRLGAVVVHCERESRREYLNVYRERAIDGTPDAWQVRHLDQIRFEFDRVAFRSHLTTHYHRPSYPIDDIIGIAQRLDDAYANLRHYVTYLGPRIPRVLLVGDVRHNPDHLPEHALDPAFLPFRATSGHFLLNALHDVSANSQKNQGLRGFGLVNACDVDNVAALWNELRNPRVVALGRNAHTRLAKLDVPHGVVPHPQYVRRFHSKSRSTYGRLIHRVIATGEDSGKWPNSSTDSPDVRSTPKSSPESGSSVSDAPVATDPRSISVT